MLFHLFDFDTESVIFTFLMESEFLFALGFQWSWVAFFIDRFFLNSFFARPLSEPVIVSANIFSQCMIGIEGPNARDD